MIQLPNMLMISGSGKNVGKTTLSTLLIANLTQQGHTVYAIKTSSHLHPLAATSHFLQRGPGFDIVEEHLTLGKDSSRMLEAGAIKAYYIQANPEYFQLALKTVLDRIPPGTAILCESGGAREFIQPSVFLYLTGNGQTKNARFKELAHLTLEFNGNGWNHFNPTDIRFDGEKFTLNP